MLIFRDGSTFPCLQRTRHAAELRTVSPGRTAASDSMADLALTAVADTQRTVNKELQLHIGLLCNRPDLFE